MKPSARATARATVDFPAPAGRRSRPPSRRQRREVRGEPRVGDLRGLHPHDLDALAGRQPGDRAEQRQPVVAVGVAAGRRAARRCRARRTRRARPRSRAPRPRSPSTTVAIRSDSLTRSSPAPRTTVSPSAKQPSSATSGSSSIASGTSSASTVVPSIGPPETSMSADRLGRRRMSPGRLERRRARSPPSARGSAGSRCGSS